MLCAFRRLLFGAAFFAAASCSSDSTTAPEPPPPPDSYTFAIQNQFPHEDSLFTQGFFYLDGFFYEGTGISGESTVRKLEMSTGNTLLRAIVAGTQFGEGIAHTGGQIVQLTWLDGRAFRWNLTDFTPVDTLRYTTQGWGITFDGTHYVMSWGRDSLAFRLPTDFEEVRRVPVQDRGRRIEKLNELEYIKGEVWANVWQTDSIAIITPSTGRVRAWLDCTGLAQPGDIAPGSPTENVLNGIAYDAAGDRIFLTGKRWRKVFQITLVGP